MRPLHRIAVAAALAAALAPATVRGAGYSIYEQGAAVLGMAGAGTASVSDPSALFYNPAALTRLPGTQVLFGGTLLMPGTSFAGINPYPGYGVVEEMKSRTFYPPTLYVTHAVNSQWTLGAGVNSPFGLGVEWKDPLDFTGRYIATRADLTALNGNLTAAFHINDAWSVAAGGDLMFAKVRLDRIIMQPAPGGGGGQINLAKASLESDPKAGYGWNAAASFVPNPKWKLGATYRSKVVVDAAGDADFTQIPSGDRTLDSLAALQLPPDQGVSTVLRFPAIWSGGIAWLPSPDWTVEADFNYTEWKVFSDLPLRFTKSPSRNVTIVEDYDNSFQVRTGAEHRLPAFTYRFGYYYDQAAAPTESVSPILPDANRHGITFGLGWKLGDGGRWGLDLYELALLVENRSTDGVNRDGYDGTYKTFVNAAGLSLTYRFLPQGGAQP